MRKLPGGTEAVLGLVELGWIQVSLDVTGEVTSLKKLMVKYASMPMSLADACLVRMSERQANSVVLTLDRGFAIYRKNGRQAIPLITPKRK
jgi:predicted nucleic acid-binding protein